MKREEILNEMKAALERYKTIKKEVFYFGMFISNWDNINHCGSVCCLWGWEPKFGVLPVKWDEDNLMRVDKKPQQVIHWGDILYYLYYPSVKDIDVFKKYDTKP